MHTQPRAPWPAASDAADVTGCPGPQSAKAPFTCTGAASNRERERESARESKRERGKRREKKIKKKREKVRRNNKSQRERERDRERLKIKAEWRMG